ncbi:MAG: STAS domain-containing protein [Kineosporiaceae bacterium]
MSPAATRAPRRHPRTASLAVAQPVTPVTPVTPSEPPVVDGPLVLAGDVTIAEAEAVLDDVRRACARLAPAAVLDLDLAAVTELDTAGLQLLLLAARETALSGGGVRVVAASDAVRRVLALAWRDERLQPVRAGGAPR